MRAERALDAPDLFLSDVRYGLGAYLRAPRCLPPSLPIAIRCAARPPAGPEPTA